MEVQVAETPEHRKGDRAPAENCGDYITNNGDREELSWIIGYARPEQRHEYNLAFDLHGEMLQTIGFLMAYLQHLQPAEAHAR